jgi:hypothetical protein
MLILPHYFGIKSIYWGSALIELTVGIVTLFLLKNYRMKVNEVRNF